MKVVITDRSKLIEEEFKEALAHFAEDETYFSDYVHFHPLGDKVLIKLFCFIPSDKTKNELGVTELLMKSPLNGEWKPKSQAMSEKIFPIVKIIKKGAKVNDPNIIEGNLYTVPYEDVAGVKWNPDFLHLMNTFSKAGTQGKLVNTPEDMPQKIRKFEEEWSRYKFAMPDRLDKETEADKLVYLIPTIKLEAVYEVV